MGSIAAVISIQRINKRQFFASAARSHGRLGRPSGMSVGAHGQMVYYQSCTRRLASYLNVKGPRLAAMLALQVKEKANCDL